MMRRSSWSLVQPVLHVGFRVSVGHSVVSHFASQKVHAEQLHPVICMQCADSGCDQELGISSKRPASVDYYVVGTVPLLLLKTRDFIDLVTAADIEPG